MKLIFIFLMMLSSTFLLSACSGSDDDEETTVDEVIEEEETEEEETEEEETEEEENEEETEEEETEEETSVDVLSVDISLFAIDSLVSYDEVSCTLTNGDTTTCYEITVTGFPADREELGDFCPDNIDATADEAGTWIDGGLVYDVDGEFIQSLNEFYGDDFWQLYDESTGDVFVTDTEESCFAAAQPVVAEEYYNHCVQCDLTYYAEQGTGIEETFTIPVTPVLRDAPGDLGGNVGVALNGVGLAAAAPTAVILGAYTIAAFDDCIGHVNPFAGYHYHGANHGYGDCPAVEFESDGHAGIIGYAMDGIAIYGLLDENGDEPDELDECRGQTDDVRGYHYHAAGPGENAFIGCNYGETVMADMMGPPQ